MDIALTSDDFYHLSFDKLFIANNDDGVAG